MSLPWNVYAVNYDRALKIAERLDLNGGTHIEASSHVIFGFANRVEGCETLV
jgi:hypothetical protein